MFDYKCNINGCRESVCWNGSSLFSFHFYYDYPLAIGNFDFYDNSSCWSMGHIEQGHKFFEIKSPIR